MKCIYKYIGKERLPSFLDGSSIALSPPVLFQDVDKLGTEIGDKGEGQTTSIIKGETVVDTNDHPSLKRILGSRTVTMENVAVRSSARDTLLFCASGVPDFRAAQKMKYDTIVRIKNPDAFFRAISAAIESEYEFVDFKPIEIRKSRETRWKDKGYNECPYWIKPEGYAYQNEVRGVWVSKKGFEAKDRKIVSAKISQFVEEYKAA